MARTTDNADATGADTAQAAAETPAVPATTAAARTEQLRTDVEDTVLLAPLSPFTTLEIPVEGGKPIVLKAGGTPVKRDQVQHVVERAALTQESVGAITPDGVVPLSLDR